MQLRRTGREDPNVLVSGVADAVVERVVAPEDVCDGPVVVYGAEEIEVAFAEDDVRAFAGAVVRAVLGVVVHDLVVGPVQEVLAGAHAEAVVGFPLAFVADVVAVPQVAAPDQAGIASLARSGEHPAQSFGVLVAGPGPAVGAGQQ